MHADVNYRVRAVVMATVQSRERSRRALNYADRHRHHAKNDNSEVGRLQREFIND